MRVAVVGPAPPLRGGIAAHTSGLFDALLEAGHEAAVFSYSRLYPGLLFPGRTQFAAGATATQGSRALLDPMNPSSWFRARRTIRDYSADLLVAEWWHPAMAPMLSSCTIGLPRTKVAYVCHNAYPHERFPAASGLSRLGLRHPDLVLCHSRWVAAQLQGLGVRAPVRTVPMPLLLSGPDGEGCTARVRRTRARLGLKPEQKVVMFAGMVRAYKGIELLLRAWRSSSASRRHRLVIAGESYLGRGKLESLVRDLADPCSVVLEDRYLSNEELLSTMQVADVFVLPYLRASQSGLLPLALGMGLPTIVSDAGGLGEERPGSGVEVVAAGDRGALAYAIDRLISARRDAAQRSIGHDQARESWAPLVEALQGATRLHS